MKKFIILFTLLVSITINVYSQTGADYYLPLCVGNYGTFDTPESGNYGGRKTVYHIKQTDIIGGQTCYLQEAYEIGDYSPNDTSIFQQFWLRKDEFGNILMVAVNMNGTGLVSDAIILPTPHKYIPNEYLTLGYTRSYVFGDETTYDTVLSVSETVGTYNNCILVRETSVSDSVNIIDQYYYAPHAGIVKMQRLYHRGDPQEYTASLTDILANDCNVGLRDIENENNISIYPNPANDIISLEINNSNNKDLTLDIYNILGKKVRTEKISNNQNQINVKDLNNGTYILEIKTNEWTKINKLIINR